MDFDLKYCMGYFWNDL